MDIKCRRTTCQFNKGQTCCSCAVCISQNALCKTFEKQENVDEDNLDFSKSMFHVAPAYKNSRHIKNIVLTCGAENCLFNKMCKCRANGITVIDEKGESRCATFLRELN